jgi:hypothetical protein
MPQDLYEKITSNRGVMAKIGEKLPGYRGYMDAQARREADHMLREFVMQKLDHQYRRIVPVEKILLNQGGIQYMDDTAALKTKFQMLIDKIRTAERGHSGLWSNTTVGTEELQRLYAFDEAMLDYVDDLAARVDELEKAAVDNAEIPQVMLRFDSMLEEVIQAFELREQTMLGVTDSGEQSGDSISF